MVVVTGTICELSHPVNVKRDFVKLSKRYFYTALDVYDFVLHVELFTAMTCQHRMLGSDEWIIIIREVVISLTEPRLVELLGGRPQRCYAIPQGKLPQATPKHLQTGLHLDSLL